MDLAKVGLILSMLCLSPFFLGSECEKNIKFNYFFSFIRNMEAKIRHLLS